MHEFALCCDDILVFPSLLSIESRGCDVRGKYNENSSSPCVQFNSIPLRFNIISYHISIPLYFVVVVVFVDVDVVVATATALYVSIDRSSRSLFVVLFRSFSRQSVVPVSNPI